MSRSPHCRGFPKAMPKRLLAAVALLFGAASGGCQVQSWIAPVPAERSARAAYVRLVRRVLNERYPQVLRASSGHAQYLWIVTDGRGRLVRTALDARRPALFAIPNAITERFPDVPIDEWNRMTNAAFSTTGMSPHPPGEVAPDTLWVFWAERPFPLSAAPRPLGPFRIAEAFDAMLVPDTVREVARGVGAGRTVWFVKGDDQRLMGIGTWPEENPDIARRQAELAPRFPGGELTCSLGLAVRGASGRLVRVFPIRFQKTEPAAR
jgi:hypothetical protein